MLASTLPRHSHLSHSEDVVLALESRGLIDPSRHEEAAGVLDELATGQAAQATTLRRVLAEVAGYVGAAFVVAAVAVFVAPRWLDMSLTIRIVLLLGTAALLCGAGLAVGITGGGLASLRTAGGSLRRRLASVLFTGASVSAAAATMVYFIDWADQGQTSEAYIPMGGGLTLAVLAALGYLAAPTLLGQAAVAVGLTAGSTAAWEALGEATAFRISATVMVLGFGWLVMAETRLWREQLPARLFGAALLVVGAQMLLPDHASWSYVVTAIVGVAGFALYAVLRAWPYLAMGVVAVTLAVAEALLDWTTGSFGTSAALLGAGVTLLVSSLVGLRMRRTQGASGRNP